MLLQITPHVAIDDSEIAFSASRSGGPGGQHVNKTSTRVLLEFDIQASPNLSDDQKARLTRRLSSRLTKDGRLQVVSAESRSQLANREAAQERLIELLRFGLKPDPKPRRTTKPSKAARERRLLIKKRRGNIKKDRGRPGPDE